LQPKRICIIGGGITGLSAAVFLASKLNSEQAQITVFEASPKLGGRAYSFFDKQINGFIDNGQHILASWFSNTLEFLEIIGSLPKLRFQEQLKVRFSNLDGKQFKLELPQLIPPLHLIVGIMKYRALRFKDKIGIFRMIKVAEKMSDDELRNLNTDELFRLTSQSKALVDNFWKPIIVAVFNAMPEETSALLFVRLLNIGFLSNGSLSLILPKANLNSLYVEPSLAYLRERNVTTICSSRVRNIVMNRHRVEKVIIEHGDELSFDFYISAVSFFDADALVGDKIKIGTLRPSPIINIHHLIDRDVDCILEKHFVGILGGTIQWVFKTGRRQICSVISSAKDHVETEKSELERKSIHDLQRAIPGFRKVKFINSKVVKEKRATFIPDKESLHSRPNHETGIKNFFIAGDWTNTGYPCTLESAVTSAKKCAELILNQIQKQGDVTSPA